jgi:hypothetical protein
MVIMGRYGVDPLDMTWARFMEYIRMNDIAGKIITGKGLDHADAIRLQKEAAVETIASAGG